MVPVRFASSQFFDSERGLILFTAFSNHAVIRCGIGVDTLVEHFHADPGSPLRSFVRHRHAIERLVVELIGEERFDEDGSILVRSADCHRLMDVVHRPAAMPQRPTLSA